MRFHFRRSRRLDRDILEMWRLKLAAAFAMLSIKSGASAETWWLDSSVANILPRNRRSADREAWCSEEVFALSAGHFQ